MKKIAFAGTDGRTLLWAHVVSTARSEKSDDKYQGVVVRGTPAMPQFVKMMSWPVSFISTQSNSLADYTTAIVTALKSEKIDYIVPMPEGLLFDGLVNQLEESGFGEHVVGLKKKASRLIEGDKIACKRICDKAKIPVADLWAEVDARDYDAVLSVCLKYIDQFGGVVLKYPFSAGGKGARIIRNTWEIKSVYDNLMADYKDAYRKEFTKKPWPLLIESLMSGVEISFTILVDGNGHYQILPTAMDYPERFEGVASSSNPITGGTGAVSPHPMETSALIEMVKTTVATPLINQLHKMNLLRPCILYPGCFVSFDNAMQPTHIRVCEVNVRPGEPEAQPVARRLKNLGVLIEATIKGNLDKVKPEVREDQIAMSVALMTGSGGPQGQKGYPWSCTKGEKMSIDTKYLKKKGIQLIPSAMDYDQKNKSLKSDGTRVAFLNGNITLNPTESRGETANRLREKLLAVYDNDKVVVVPRENPKGNRLALRRDIGSQFLIEEETFPKK